MSKNEDYRLLNTLGVKIGFFKNGQSILGKKKGKKGYKGY